MQVGCFWWHWCQQYTDMMQQTQGCFVQAALSQGHTRQRLRGRGKGEEEGLRNTYIDLCSSPGWLHMPSVLPKMSPPSHFNTEGFAGRVLWHCQGCATDNNVLQVIMVGVKVRKSCSKWELPGNSRLHVTGSQHWNLNTISGEALSWYYFHGNTIYSTIRGWNDDLAEPSLTEDTDPAPQCIASGISKGVLPSCQ